VGPQAGFDMRNRDAGSETRQGAAQGTRCVALDDDEIDTDRQPRQQRAGDRPNMAMRIFLSRAVEPIGGKAGKTEIDAVQPRMLAGQDDPGCKALIGERIRDGCQLDRFGPGADDQPNLCAIQSSP
jgi:hypothetical protein